LGGSGGFSIHYGAQVANQKSDNEKIVVVFFLAERQRLNGLGQTDLTMKKISESGNPRRHDRPGNGILKSEAELATALGEDPRTIRNWRHSGRIPYLKLGYRTVRFNLDSVMFALGKNEVRSTSPLRKARSQ
jgi:hypothetical protein